MLYPCVLSEQNAFPFSARVANLSNLSAIFGGCAVYVACLRWLLCPGSASSQHIAKAQKWFLPT